MPVKEDSSLPPIQPIVPIPEPVLPVDRYKIRITCDHWDPPIVTIAVHDEHELRWEMLRIWMDTCLHHTPSGVNFNPNLVQQMSGEKLPK